VSVEAPAENVGPTVACISAFAPFGTAFDRVDAVAARRDQHGVIVAHGERVNLFVGELRERIDALCMRVVVSSNSHAPISVLARDFELN